MASRQTLGSGSPGPITGPTYMDNVAAHIKRLYDAAGFPLTSVAGTANAVTATLDPVLDGSGLVTGMRFGITWGTTNTGAMTLAINGGSPVAVLDSAGVAIVAGVAVAGTRALLEYVGGSFRVMTSGGGAGGVARYYQAFTASGTWTKPTGLDDDTLVLIEGWGAGGGGGGGFGGGGGGGAYVSRIMRLGDMPSSVTATIGIGGTGGVNTSGTAGGNTTFGSLLTAYGGGRGAGGTNAGQRGGGGGGAGLLGAGGNATAGGTAGGAKGRLGGTAGSSGYNGTSGGGDGNDAENERGGGSGAGAAVSGSANGGNAVNGGGGGGSYANTTAGTGGDSIFGGDGGAGATSGTATAGVAPGGGGGGSSTGSTGTGGAGARGEIRVWI